MTRERSLPATTGAKLRLTLGAWLQAQGTPPNDVTELVHHLGDIKESCETLVELIEQLPKLDLQTKRGRKHVAKTFGELFEHLSPHLRAAKRPLSALLRRTYREAEERRCL